MGWLILFSIVIFLIILHERNSLRKLIKKRGSESFSVKQSPIEDIKLSNEQSALFDILENTNSNTFITGKAGTGKSLVLQYLKKHTHKKIVVCAPTGVAAINVGGQTIHSLFKIKPGLLGKATSVVDYETDKPIGACEVFFAGKNNGDFDFNSVPQLRYLDNYLIAAKRFGDRYYHEILDTTYIGSKPLRDFPELTGLNTSKL